jgi:hypothetical protein
LKERFEPHHGESMRADAFAKVVIATEDVTSVLCITETITHGDGDGTATVEVNVGGA